MKAFSLVIGTLAVTVALSAPAAAHGRGAGSSVAPQSQSPSTQVKPATPPKTPAPITVPPSVAAKIQPLLPTGTEISVASTGFKNLGQFIAAVHVSKNLDIPFDSLKAKMTGTKTESLGQAIHDLKPTADSKAEVTKAQAEAKADQSGKH